MSRISQPQSKAATVDYLKSYFDEDIKLHKIYRYLDKLNDNQKDTIQKISVEHTRKVLGGKIGVVFYYVTTLYFETDHSDNLRKNGFSKDGKHSLPQIVLGLLVSDGGYPLAYSIHEGNKYEGHTMIPVVKDFAERFDLKDFEIFYYAALVHLVFVKIHPFQDGNGRSARLLEKWFLIEKIGEKATDVQLEKNILPKTQRLLFKY